jgi:hypothetical protein
VSEFKYLGTRVTIHNFIQEEVKMLLNSDNASHHCPELSVISSNKIIVGGSVWMRNIVSDIKRVTQTEGV